MCQPLIFHTHSFHSAVSFIVLAISILPVRHVRCRSLMLASSWCIRFSKRRKRGKLVPVSCVVRKKIAHGSRAVFALFSGHESGIFPPVCLKDDRGVTVDAHSIDGTRSIESPSLRHYRYGSNTWRGVNKRLTLGQVTVW